MRLCLRLRLGRLLLRLEGRLADSLLPLRLLDGLAVLLLRLLKPLHRSRLLGRRLGHRAQRREPGQPQGRRQRLLVCLLRLLELGQAVLLLPARALRERAQAVQLRQPHCRLAAAEALKLRLGDAQLTCRFGESHLRLCASQWRRRLHHGLLFGDHFRLLVLDRRLALGGGPCLPCRLLELLRRLLERLQVLPRLLVLRRQPVALARLHQLRHGRHRLVERPKVGITPASPSVLTHRVVLDHSAWRKQEAVHALVLRVVLDGVEDRGASLPAEEGGTLAPLAQREEAHYVARSDCAHRDFRLVRLPKHVALPAVHE